MRHLLSGLLRKLESWRYQCKVKDALALHRRGEARADGLTLDNVCNRLEIRWRARDIHPWDRDLPTYDRETAFAEQAMADTEAAIFRLFERLPQIDVIDLGVLEPTSEHLIAAGTVHRSVLTTPGPHFLSVGMRLREVGVLYRFAEPERVRSDANLPAGELCAR